MPYRTCRHFSWVHAAGAGQAYANLCEDLPVVLLDPKGPVRWVGVCSALTGHTCLTINPTLPICCYKWYQRRSAVFDERTRDGSAVAEQGQAASSSPDDVAGQEARSIEHAHEQSGRAAVRWALRLLRKIV
jgi:hypothetical protein